MTLSYQPSGVDPLSDLARATGNLSQLPDMALLLATVQIARDQAITFDQAALHALDALYWVREAQKTWSPPPGYRAADLPRDYVQQLIGFVQRRTGRGGPHCAIGSCSRENPICDTMQARVLLDRLNLPWQADE